MSEPQIPYKAMLGYFLAAVLWLLGCSYLLPRITLDPSFGPRAVELGGLVVVIGLLLYFLLKRWPVTAVPDADTRAQLATANDRLDLQYTLVLELAQAEDLQQALRRVLQKICEQLQMAVGAVWWPDLGGTRLACAGTAGQREAGLEAFIKASQALMLRPGEGLPGRAWQSGAVDWIADLAQAPELPRSAAAQAAGLKAGFAFAIRHDDRVLAVIELFSTEPRAADEALVALMDLLGLQLGLLIDARRGETAAKEDLALIEQAQELAHMGLWTWTPADNQLAWSERVFEICGQAQSEQPNLAGFLANIVHPADRHLIARAAADLAAGKAIAVECRIERPDGQRRHVYLKGRPVLEDGKVIRASGFIQDISERKLAETRLKDSEQRFELAFRETPIASLISSVRDGRLLDVNTALVELSGYTREALCGRTATELDFWTDPADREHLLRRLDAEGIVRNLPLKLRRGDGELRDVLFHASRVYLGDRLCLLIQVQDVTELKRLEQDLQLAASALAHTTEMVLISDANRRIVFANPAFTRATGYTLAEARGRYRQELLHHATGKHSPDYFEEIERILTIRGHWEGEVWTQSKDGRVFPELLSLSLVRNAAGEVTHCVGLASDITELKAREARLELLAHHDALTGLPNRQLFQDRCRKAIQRARRRGHMLAVLYLDLDRFKHVNDSYGHPVGDALLKETSRRMSACVREADTVARLGGDEFVILLDDLTEIDGARRVAKQLIEAIQAPLDIEGQPLTVSTSIGIALYPQHGKSAKTLLGRADQALYRAKADGRNGYQLFRQ